MRIKFQEYFFNPLVKVDILLDKVPVFSTVTNLVDIFQKTVLVLIGNKFFKKNKYAIHLRNKNFFHCIGLLIPVLGNIYIYICYSRKITSLIQDPKIVSPNGFDQAQLKSSENFLKSLWDKFDAKKVIRSTTFLDQECQFSLYLKKNGSAIDLGFQANPLLAFKDSPDVFYIPANSRAVCKPNQEDHFSSLANTLKAAFISGKKIVVTQFSSDKHAIAAGFLPDGSFKIIDSMGGAIVDIKQLTGDLNKARIPGADGKAITFRGEYVNTHIQKGGYECLRFSALYCYQMAKKLSLKAYKEVNGAFLEGLLLRYEDYQKIEGTRKVKNIGDQKCEYKTFMLSWAYRICNYTVDDWQQIKVGDLKRPETEYEGSIAFYILKQNQSPQAYCGFEKGDAELIYEDQHGNQTTITDFTNLPLKILDLPLNYSEATLGDLAPKIIKEKHVLLFEKGNDTPRLCHLPIGHKLICRFYYDGIQQDTEINAKCS